MEAVVLSDLAVGIDFDLLKRKLRIRDGRYDGDLKELAAGAQAVANPKAVYRTVYIDEKGPDHVVIGGITFISRVLRVNLEEAQRVFPYVVTCGVEIDQWSRDFEDILFRYWIDTIKELLMRSALQILTAHIIEDHSLPRSAVMAPGSLEDWPITEQRALFSLIGDVEGLVGVRLTESLLMVPTKSISGIRFPTQGSFESCQLCPRPKCPGRRAPYEEGLYEKRYRA